jgi:hypothetical protein
MFAGISFSKYYVFYHLFVKLCVKLYMKEDGIYQIISQNREGHSHYRKVVHLKMK